MEKLKILNLNFSFQRAAHYHINGGMLLMGVVLLAMFLANSCLLYTSPSPRDTR